MLFEAMPLSLRSDKRKSAHSHEDLPLSKKVALDRRPVRKSKTGQLNFIGSAEKFTLSSGSDQAASRSIDEWALRRKNNSLDTKLALDVHSGDGEDVTNKNLSRMKHENGLSKTDNQHTSEDEEDLLGESDIDGSYTLDSEVPILSPTLSGPRSKLGSPSRTDIFETNSNGDAISQSMKQPSLVLEHLKKTGERKKSGYDRTLAESASSSLLFGGYMRRMASLNASACVTALMEPEKKNRPHKNTLSKSPHKIGVDSSETQLRQQEPRKSWSLSPSDDLSPGMPPIVGLDDLEHSRDSRVKDSSLSPARFYSSPSSSDEADTSKDSDDFLGVTEPHQVYTLLALATLASAVSCELDEIPFNKLGLLYNGDTIHPAAKVFYTSDTDLTLPDRIIPRVVPSREEFLRSAISKAVVQRSIGKKRKGAKVSYIFMHAFYTLLQFSYKHI